MKLHFQQSGGFAGLVRGCELDVKDLPAALAALAEELAAGKVPATGPNRAARDDLRYRISLDRGGRRVAFETTPSTLPERFEPLVEFLVESSHPMPLH